MEEPLAPAGGLDAGNRHTVTSGSTAAPRLGGAVEPPTIAEQLLAAPEAGLAPPDVCLAPVEDPLGLAEQLLGAAEYLLNAAEHRLDVAEGI
ncbi:hypothetical protein GCM10028821_21440 [Hymenobacter jeollabukensis]